ncbi:MAG TPA: hypothetical protein VFD32_02900 [Dehalococcoidia bacterium]|nr:hypothetical protein [Dehalococcoidia bacterium]
MRSVAFHAGWNLIGVPTGTTVGGSASALYTYGSERDGYVLLDSNTPLQAGVGYWAYFDKDTSIAVRIDSVEFPAVPLPAGEWVLIGNPLGVRVEVAGQDVLYVFDPTTQRYFLQFASILEPGSGAWAYSADGGILTFRRWAPPPTCQSGQVLTQGGCAWPTPAASQP